MEMESSQRRPPFDRSREATSLKKPRLSASDDPRRLPVGSGSGSGRFRANESSVGEETTSSVRGALQQYQQYQELVNQYKTALAELTFNSKPIITNLTIIAGENLQAARAIAGTICTNILEVPSEQKLPSLYLLDSIVKNIGGDYIKYFAPRLPEVFCKAYRHVDPSIHPGMRHLFGTWKGVFPPQQLQIIEKELGFSATVNGPSSASTTSKSDLLSQRQSHSIHVNPKYLEARQRLQQTSRPKPSEIGGTDVGSPEDVERPETTASAGAERSWADPSMKMHNIQRPQRENLRVPGLQKQGRSGSGDYEFTSGLKRPLNTPAGKPNERMVGHGYGKRWPGAGVEPEESISTQRNGYDIKCGMSYSISSRSAGNIVPSMQNPPRTSAEPSRSWKNSEEEEYMWDDLGVRVGKPGGPAVKKRDFLSSDDMDKSEFSSQLPKWHGQTEARSSFEREHSADLLSSEHKEHTPFGHPRTGSPLLQQVGSRAVVGPSHVRPPSFCVQATSVSTTSVVHRYPSPGQSVMHHHPPTTLSKGDPRQSPVEKDFMKSQSLARSDPREASFRGRHQNLQQGNLQKSQTQALQKPSSVIPSFDQRPYVPSSDYLSSPETELSGVVEKTQKLLSSSSLKRPASLDSLNPVLADSQGHSNVSSLLASVMKSGLLSSISVSEQAGVQPSTAPFTSKVVVTSTDDSDTPSASPKKVEKPRVVPGLATSKSSVISPLPQTSCEVSSDANPLSILSTLMSKGLISAPKTESMAPAHAESEVKFQEQVSTVANKSSVVVPSVTESLSTPPQSSNDNISSSVPAEKGPDISVRSTKTEVEDPIGFEFRPPVLRQFHQVVIDRLSDNLPHMCTSCGLGFKLEERLARHLEWHDFKNSQSNCLNRPVRRWYSNATDWIAGKRGFPFGYSVSSEGSRKTGEEDEKMVPADESQCVCLLCGELFQDFYSEERYEWMFKGAVYLSSSPGSSEEGPSVESDVQNLIVHANCMSDEAIRDLGLARSIRLEKVA